MLHKFRIKLYLAALLLGFSVMGARAASIIVNVANDPAGVGSCATGGNCSLRQAVITAVAGDGIFFNLPAANCPNDVCTINLTSGLIITKSLNIYGTGTKTLIINGSAAGGAQTLTVLTIGDAQSLITVTMSGLTISGGYTNLSNPIPAGGIVVASGATATLNYVNVTNNRGDLAGGIFCSPTQVAAAFVCKLTLINSLVSGNTGKYAGGIENQGVMQIVNSTISGNLATTTDALQNSAGGISNGFPQSQVPADINIISSTIANNTASSSSYIGGMANYSTLARIRNTIIANNTSAGTVSDVGGSFTSRGNNLIANTGGSSGFGIANSNDIVNQSANLAPLANNGGQTDTHALLAGSPAINAGNNCVLNVSCASDNAPTALGSDQRGEPFARKSGSAVDIGAYELQSRKTPFDFDGDGKSDVAVTRASGGNLAWYLLNSQTGFTGVSFGVATDRMVPADYDGDGKTDVAVVRTNPDNSLSWYLLQSRDGFTGQTFGIVGDTPVPADYDGDGKADVAVTRTANGALSWYINRSQLGFTGYQFGAAGDVPVTGDYDGDGKSDAAVARAGGGNLSWYINRSQLGFVGYQFGLASDKPVAGDYDGDGKTDVAVMRTSGGSVNWYLQQSTSGFTGVGFGTAGDVPVPADYDGDGKTDIAVARANGSALNWYLLRSQSGFTGVGFGASSDKAVENAYIP